MSFVAIKSRYRMLLLLIIYHCMLRHRRFLEKQAKQVKGFEIHTFLIKSRLKLVENCLFEWSIKNSAWHHWEGWWSVSSFIMLVLDRFMNLKYFNTNHLFLLIHFCFLCSTLIICLFSWWIGQLQRGSSDHPW